MSQVARKLILITSTDPTLVKLLNMLLADSFEVVQCKTGDEAFERSVSLRPQLIIIDDAVPGGGSIALCGKLRRNPATRHAGILLLSGSAEMTIKISAFEAGADEFITKPFDSKELMYRVKNLVSRVHIPTEAQPAPAKHGRVIACFGTKGGVGKTTVAVNTALALHRQSGGRVAIFDADFFFGDVGVHLNVPPTRSVMDLIEHVDNLDAEFVDQIVLRHPTGLRVLLSPFSPEKADLITAEHIKAVVGFLAELNDYVVVDCHATYDDRTLSILDRADEILLIVTPEVGPLKNTRMFLDIAEKLGISLDKVHIVLNRSNSNVGIESQEIERSFKHRVQFSIVSGGRPVVMSVNQGQPLLTGKLDNAVAQEIIRIADWIIKNSPKA
ncbi:MAG TPA: response regulator [Anaerolineae bacterium]